VPRSPPVRPPHPGRQERPRQRLPAGALGQAATAAAGTATFLGERYARIARRRGKAKAQVAVVRFILTIIWHLLENPEARFTDLGYGYYQACTDIDRKLKNHIRQIQALGFDATVTRTA
jgi:transposase